MTSAVGYTRRDSSLSVSVIQKHSVMYSLLRESQAGVVVISHPSHLYNHLGV